MIAYLQGKLVEKQPARVILDVNGVGYEVFVPLSSYDRLPAQGEECRLLTHDYVREDTRQLFGFATAAEKKMFELLLSTSGIGPRLALSALSSLTVRELTAAVADGDVKRLSSISGVGKKMAQRMVVELRDKLSDSDVLEATTGSTGDGEQDRVLRDTLLALVALGYTQESARKMVAQAKERDPSARDVESMVRHAIAR